MKRYVEIEPICPLLGGKPCIKDGWQLNSNVYHPCMLWDGDRVFNGVPPTEPCRFLRALNRILSDEVTEAEEMCVPWDTNGKEK